PLKSLLQIKNNADDTKDSVLWKWKKGADTPFSALGDPRATDAYSFCVYDESGTAPVLALAATAPAGGTCLGVPCWKETGTSGFAYKNTPATPEGLTQVKIKSGIGAKPQATVKGKGTRLLLPGLPLAAPVRAQLHAATGECWEAVHDVVVKSDAAQSKAKDGP